MKKVIVLMMALLFSVAALAGEKKQSLSAPEALAKMEAKLAAKPWLGVEYEKAEKSYYKIEKVVANSPAERAGFQAGDILLSMSGVDYTKANKKALKAAWAKVEPGSDAEFVVKRAGEKLNLTATLQHIPSDLQAQWIAEYMDTNYPDYQLAEN